MRKLAREDEETRQLLRKIEQGDREAFDQLFAQHREGLRQSIELRLDPRLRARFDASDVVQEAQVEAYTRLPDFLERRPMPFGLWLLKTAHQRLIHLRRLHLDAQRRTVAREIKFSENSSLAIASMVMSQQTSLGSHLSQRERAEQLAAAIEELDADSREALLMRHVEGLTHQQMATLLDITPEAARKRYGRALLRLQRTLSRRGLNDSQ